MSTESLYDLLIVGAGPAGVAATIYGARRGWRVAVVANQLGGQVAWASDIENYPGITKISGPDLADSLVQQINQFAERVFVTEAVSVTHLPDQTFQVKTATGDSILARVVLVAIGLRPRRLGLPEEKTWFGHGVSYCANCDGPLFKNKVVAVVGGGNSALDSAEVLSRIASRVYLIHRRTDFRAFADLISVVNRNDKITKLMPAEVIALAGDKKLTKITVKQAGQTKELAVDGLFIEIGSEADSAWLGESVDLDSQGRILSDHQGRTKTPGLLVAGDIASGHFQQISVAVGDGTTAALMADDYLRKLS